MKLEGNQVTLSLCIRTYISLTHRRFRIFKRYIWKLLCDCSTFTFSTYHFWYAIYLCLTNIFNIFDLRPVCTIVHCSPSVCLDIVAILDVWKGKRPLIPFQTWANFCMEIIGNQVNLENSCKVVVFVCISCTHISSVFLLQVWAELRGSNGVWRCRSKQHKKRGKVLVFLFIVLLWC